MRHPKGAACAATKLKAETFRNDAPGGARCGRRHATMWRMRLTRGAAIPALGLALAGSGGCGGAKELTIPVAYVVAGRVVDPTTNPVTGVAGASLSIEPGSSGAYVRPVTSDADGYFVLQGVPPGIHRLRASLAGRRTTWSHDLAVERNLAGALLPLFTDGEIDSILLARGAPAWDRGQALLGVFALRSTGVPLGDAIVTLAPAAGGTLVQTGQGRDPIVLVNAAVGDRAMSLTRNGYLWDGPYSVALRGGVLVFAAPRARPNFNGFVFADRASGPPVSGALVEVLEGPTRGVQSTSNFLSQFSLVGLLPGRYVARAAAAGFLPTVTWPQGIAQDTTLAQVIVEPDTLAAWSVAAGGPAPSGTLGHVLIDARAIESGAALDGATVEVDPTWGAAAAGGAAGSATLAQTARSPALRLNLASGLYRIFARAPGRSDSPATDSVRVRAGEMTVTRVDF